MERLDNLSGDPDDDVTILFQRMKNLELQVTSLTRKEDEWRRKFESLSGFLLEKFGFDLLGSLQIEDVNDPLLQENHHQNSGEIEIRRFDLPKLPIKLAHSKTKMVNSALTANDDDDRICSDNSNNASSKNLTNFIQSPHFSLEHLSLYPNLEVRKIEGSTLGYNNNSNNRHRSYSHSHAHLEDKYDFLQQQRSNSTVTFGVKTCPNLIIEPVEAPITYMDNINENYVMEDINVHDHPPHHDKFSNYTNSTCQVPVTNPTVIVQPQYLRNRNRIDSVNNSSKVEEKIIEPGYLSKLEKTLPFTVIEPLDSDIEETQTESAMMMDRNQSSSSKPFVSVATHALPPKLTRVIPETPPRSRIKEQVYDGGHDDLVMPSPSLSPPVLDIQVLPIPSWSDSPLVTKVPVLANSNVSSSIRNTSTVISQSQAAEEGEGDDEDEEEEDDDDDDDDGDDGNESDWEAERKRKPNYNKSSNKVRTSSAAIDLTPEQRKAAHACVRIKGTAWECKLCNKSFTTRCSGRRHARVVHFGQKPGIASCRKCKQEFSDKQSRIEHKKTCGRAYNVVSKRKSRIYNVNNKKNIANNSSQVQYSTFANLSKDIKQVIIANASNNNLPSSVIVRLPTGIKSLPKSHQVKKILEGEELDNGYLRNDGREEEELESNHNNSCVSFIDKEIRQQKSQRPSAEFKSLNEHDFLNRRLIKKVPGLFGYMCGICQMKHKYEETAISHIKEFHKASVLELKIEAEKKQLYNCTFCLKSFDDEKTHEMHEKSCSGSRSDLEFIGEDFENIPLVSEMNWSDYECNNNGEKDEEIQNQNGQSTTVKEASVTDNNHNHDDGNEMDENMTTAAEKQYQNEQMKNRKKNRKQTLLPNKFMYSDFKEEVKTQQMRIDQMELTDVDGMENSADSEPCGLKITAVTSYKGKADQKNKRKRKRTPRSRSSSSSSVSRRKPKTESFQFKPPVVCGRRRRRAARSKK